jgi:hypothetical protein
MKRSDVAALAASINLQFADTDKRMLRAALRQAASSLEVAAPTDDAIKSAMTGAFNVKAVAAAVGCTPSRVSKLAKASGFRKLGPGVFQA